MKHWIVSIIRYYNVYFLHYRTHTFSPIFTTKYDIHIIHGTIYLPITGTYVSTFRMCWFSNLQIKPNLTVYNFVQYARKSKYVGHEGMVVRAALTCIGSLFCVDIFLFMPVYYFLLPYSDNNINATREQATTASGQERFNIVCARYRKYWLLKACRCLIYIVISVFLRPNNVLKCLSAIVEFFENKYRNIMNMQGWTELLCKGDQEG